MNYLVNPPGIYKLARLCILADYRKHKFGRDLVERAHEWVREDMHSRGLTTARSFCNSQIPVKGFYSRYVTSQSCSAKKKQVLLMDSDLRQKYGLQG